jgi:hypothetical protein
MATKVITRKSQAVMHTLSPQDLLREEAVRAKDMIESGYMLLARCLYDIYHQDVYSTYWNYINFEDYIDKEIQIAYRKAMYLVEIYGKAKLLNMDMDRLERMGWSKARELIRIVDESNVSEWMDRAENCTVKELNIQVKKEKDKTADKSSIVEEAPIITTITFKLGMAEHAIIDDALQESKSLINSNDLALALANICQEWMESKGVVPQHSTLEDHIAHLQQIYGRKLVISGVSPTETITNSVDDEDEDDIEESTITLSNSDNEDPLDEFL